MTKIFFISTALISFFITSTFAQTDSLRNKIQKIVTSKRADIGVAIYGFENKDTLTINGSRHFPMQSVFKFHVALAVLNEVDKGRLSINQEIYVKRSDLLPKTWSPLREDYPDGNIKLRLSEILSYTVSKSDNNGCDILLRLIGGVKTVQSYMDSIGLKDFSIRANEEEMAKGWDVQFSNWTTPISSLQLLKNFYNRQILTKTSYDFLWEILIKTSTGVHRIKGQLPPNTEVAHKTGTSDTNIKGFTAAVNDIGIVKLPSGKHFAICVYVSNTLENIETNEKIIADITKLYWDYLVNKK